MCMYQIFNSKGQYVCETCDFYVAKALAAKVNGTYKAVGPVFYTTRVE